MITIKELAQELNVSEQATALNHARKEGIAEGIAEGEARGREAERQRELQLPRL